MKTDAQLKRDVEAELEWDPAVHATHVGVAVNGGVVTLTGHIDSYAEKHAIERAVQRVEGVRATAVELDVKLAPGHLRSDSEIATAAEATLHWHTRIPADSLRVRVEKGYLTLSGEVEWEYQRNEAEKALRHLTGVVGIVNAITLKAQTTPTNVSNLIRDALTRQAASEAKRIDVAIKGATVTLSGSVHSWSERAAAQGAAWSAPGVGQVVNQLAVTG
jgi:osmotically-inducible protein OsmY